MYVIFQNIDIIRPNLMLYNKSIIKYKILMIAIKKDYLY